MNIKHKTLANRLIMLMTMIVIVIITTIITLITNTVYANVAVIDSANLANSAKQVEAWRQQLDQMRRQLDLAHQQYYALSGSRGLGYTAYNHKLNQYLPSDYADIYNNLAQNDIAGIISKLTRDEELSGSCNDIQQQINRRSKNTIVTDKAVNLQGYEIAKQRLAQVDALMSQINQSQDMKAINELQARINVEQIAIQNEIVKMQLVSHLQAAEQQLISEQKRELNRRLLSNNNHNMPRIK